MAAVTFCSLLALGEMALFAVTAQSGFSTNENGIVQSALVDVEALIVFAASGNAFETNFVRYLLKEYPSPLMLFVQPPSELQFDRGSYVLICDMESLPKLVEMIRDPPSSRCFLVISEAITDGEKVLIETCRALWLQRGQTHIHIFAPNGIFVYKPFAVNADDQKHGKISRVTESFQPELRIDMNRLPVLVDVFASRFLTSVVGENGSVVLTGPDGETARLVADMLHFEAVFPIPRNNTDGFLNTDKYFTKLADHQSDILFIGYYIRDYETSGIQFSVSVYDDQLLVYVPRAKRIPYSLVALHSVGVYVWASFIATAFACACVWMAMRAMNLWIFPRLHSHRGYLRIFTDTWVAWVRADLLAFPSSASESTLVIVLCLMSVIFGAIFESCLSTSYIQPFYYKDIRTLEDLDESGMSILYQAESLKDDVFVKTASELFAHLNSKCVLTNLSNRTLEEIVATDGGSAGIVSNMNLLVNHYQNMVAKKISLVAECPKHYNIAYVLPRLSPLVEYINMALLRLMEAGLIDFWIQRTFLAIKSKVARSTTVHEDPPFRPLGLLQLQLPFYVIAMGGLGALLLFVVEVSKSKPNERLANIN